MIYSPLIIEFIKQIRVSLLGVKVEEGKKCWISNKIKRQNLPQTISLISVFP